MKRRIFDVVLVVIGVLALWQAVHELVGEVALTSPWTTVLKAADLAAAAWFWDHAAATGLSLSYALLIALIGGVGLGTLLGAHRLSGTVAEPILVSLYSLPKITLYPLLLLIFGLGLDVKVVFGAIHGIIPVTIFTMNAVKNMNPIYVKTARVLKLTPWQTAGRVLLPGALPEIASALRIGFSLTLLGLVIGEMFASRHGLGFLIINAVSLHEVDTLMAVALMLAVCAISVGAALLYVDNRLHQRG